MTEMRHIHRRQRFARKLFGLFRVSGKKHTTRDCDVASGEAERGDLSRNWLAFRE